MMVVLIVVTVSIDADNDDDGDGGDGDDGGGCGCVDDAAVQWCSNGNRGENLDNALRNPKHVHVRMVAWPPVRPKPFPLRVAGQARVIQNIWTRARAT